MVTGRSLSRILAGYQQFIMALEMSSSSGPVERRGAGCDDAEEEYGGKDCETHNRGLLSATDIDLEADLEDREMKRTDFSQRAALTRCQMVAVSLACSAVFAVTIALTTSTALAVSLARMFVHFR